MKHSGPAKTRGRNNREVEKPSGGGLKPGEESATSYAKGKSAQTKGGGRPSLGKTTGQSAVKGAPGPIERSKIYSVYGARGPGERLGPDLCAPEKGDYPTSRMKKKGKTTSVREARDLPQDKSGRSARALIRRGGAFGSRGGRRSCLKKSGKNMPRILVARERQAPLMILVQGEAGRRLCTLQEIRKSFNETEPSVGKENWRLSFPPRKSGPRESGIENPLLRREKINLHLLQANLKPTGG